MTASSPFMYLLIATNLRQGIDGAIEVMLRMCLKHALRNPCYKTIDVRPTDYLCYISFLNMNCANWRNSCILGRTTV